MHVLIIGGTRFVGYGLVWRLLARGDRVTVLNRGTMPDPFGDTNRANSTSTGMMQPLGSCSPRGRSTPRSTLPHSPATMHAVRSPH